MKIMMYKAISTASALITQYDIDMLDLDGNELFNIADSANQASPLTGTTNEDTKLTIDNFKIVNVPKDTFRLQLGSTTPDNGTATVKYTSTLTSVSGVVTSRGEWTYTPDSDFNGVDTFTIDLLYGDSAQYNTISNTVNVTVNAIQDVTSTTLGPFAVSIGSPSVEDVSGNDSFSSPTYAIVSNGSRGTATISSGGVITYNASTAGSDTVVYSVTPTGGTAENVTVQYTNS